MTLHQLAPVTGVHCSTLKWIPSWLMALKPSTADLKDNHSHLPPAHPHIHTQRCSLAPHTYTRRLLAPLSPLTPTCAKDLWGCLVCLSRDRTPGRLRDLTVCPLIPESLHRPTGLHLQPDLLCRIVSQVATVNRITFDCITVKWNLNSHFYWLSWREISIWCFVSRCTTF